VDMVTISIPGALAMRAIVVGQAPMWAGTIHAHCRMNLTNFTNLTVVTPTNFPTGRVDGVAVTFSVFRPFGGAAVATGRLGTLYTDVPPGRGGYSGGQYYSWTNILDTASTTDIRDGMTRAAGLDFQSYADGDGVVVTAGGPSASVYVVVRVERMRDNNGLLIKRCYLMRDAAAWPGP
jgi:hypothetical protein